MVGKNIFDLFFVCEWLNCKFYAYIYIYGNTPLVFLNFRYAILKVKNLLFTHYYSSIYVWFLSLFQYWLCATRLTTSDYACRDLLGTWGKGSDNQTLTFNSRLWEGECSHPELARFFVFMFTSIDVCLFKNEIFIHKQD